MINLFHKKPATDSIYSEINADLTSRQEIELAHTVVRELDRIFDRVTTLPIYRREAVRCLIAAAGTLVQVELSDDASEYRHIDATSRELIAIALNELGLELKEP